jgi:hypothetical protein
MIGLIYKSDLVLVDLEVRSSGRPNRMKPLCYYLTYIQSSLAGSADCARMEWMLIYVGRNCCIDGLIWSKKK